MTGLAQVRVEVHEAGQGDEAVRVHGGGAGRVETGNNGCWRVDQRNATHYRKVACGRGLR